MRTNNFQISLMRKDGMSIGEISAKTGLEPEYRSKSVFDYCIVEKTGLEPATPRMQI